MKHILYIIPGWNESTSQSEYQELKSHFTSREFIVVEISITWKKRVMSQYVEEFLSQCSHSSEDRVSLLGFSFGAMIAFISSQYISYTHMYLCSLSPFFKEDLNIIPKSWKTTLGKKRIEDFKTISFNEVIKHWYAPFKIYLFYGEKEHPLLIRRVKDAYEKIKYSQLISIPNCKHELSNNTYLENIKNVENCQKQVYSIPTINKSLTE